MLEQRRHGDILELHLARPPVNALNRELLSRLREAIDAAADDDGVAAVVVSGNDKVFSGGMDVPELMSLDRADLEASWRAFFAVCETLARSPLLSVAAITGHNPAGGAVISLFCDYRVMAHGPFRIGLNETQVGLAVPECIQYALRRVVGAHRAERLLVAGEMVDAATAHAIGFVDQLAEPGKVVEAAIGWLRTHLALPRQAVLETRRIARADLVDAVSDPRRLNLEGFLEAWYRDHTQAVLRAVVQKLRGGKG